MTSFSTTACRVPAGTAGPGTRVSKENKVGGRVSEGLADAFLVAMAIGHGAQIVSFDQAFKMHDPNCLILL